MGLRTIGHWSAEGNVRLDITVWYPTVRIARELNISQWPLRAAHNGKPVEGHFPLILLSHASPATRHSYHETAAWMASAGFVVAAMTHARDNMDNMSDLLTWEQLHDRAREISATIDVLVADPDISASIDKNRIGLLGFEAGGTAALLLGGALPDCHGWPGQCQSADSADMYCNAWGKKRIDKLCQTFPLGKSLADPRIKVVAAVSPGFGMLFSPNAFRHFYPPALIAIADQDRQNVPARHAAAIATMLGDKATVIDLKGADLGAVMSACPDSLALEMKEICRSVSPDRREEIHERLNAALTDFFVHWLGSDRNLPEIPAPPVLVQPANPEPKPKKPAQPRHKRRYR